jgi:antibiotic biosynthesis monooxygenase (ABM) superfamily enzyme
MHVTENNLKFKSNVKFKINKIIKISFFIILITTNRFLQSEIENLSFIKRKFI